MVILANKLECSLSSHLQYPGWILTADGSIVITTANDDAAGVYTCTPYNSYGTMGQSERTTVILQVRLSERKKKR